MKLKKCDKCSTYTLEDKCKTCNKTTKEAGIKYRDKFVKKNQE